MVKKVIKKYVKKKEDKCSDGERDQLRTRPTDTKYPPNVHDFPNHVRNKDFKKNQSWFGYRAC